MFKKGTIILVPFPFTDLTSSKVRPALIISSNTIPGEDVTVMFISSQKDKNVLYTDFVLSEKDKDFKETGLKVDSVFKTNKIATLSKKIVLGELGNLSQKLLEKVNKNIKIVFEL